MSLKHDALKIISDNQNRLFELSDLLWEHPETAYHEKYATELYCRILEEEGFTVEKNLAGIETAFSGSFGSGNPVIGFLGEFDALPGLSQEANSTVQKPVKEGEPGHGCGHNLLGTGALSAAIALKGYLEATKKSGTVKFYGCPAEEGGAGKGFMARDGVFNGLDVAFCWHPGEVNGVSRDLTMANYQISYHFHGTAAHAAMSPELGRSALDALELMNTGVQYLREHIPGNCRVHYAITNSGGNSPGIVQPYAQGLYLMRAPSLPQVKELHERINKIALGAAMMTETRVEIEFIKACSNMVLNTELLKVVQQNMEALPPSHFSAEDFAFAKAIRSTYERRASYFDTLVEDIVDPEQKSVVSANADADIHDIVMPFPEERQGFVSSDVGDVSWICPLAQVNITALPAGVAMHSWQMVSCGKSNLAKQGMLYAGKVMAASAIDLLEQPSIIERAKQEYLQRTGNTPFVSPIPPDAVPKVLNP